MALTGADIKPFLWSGAERFGPQAVGFVVIVVMSRLISKEAYGLVAMLAIFTDLALLLADSGISQALIRKGNRTQRDCSTAFWLNFGFAFVLYWVLWFSAPLVARFYGHGELIPLLRFLALGVPVNAAAMVQRALFTARTDFRRQTLASLPAALVSGIAGIAMAAAGWGVWAVAAYQLLNMALVSVALWLLSPWRPGLAVSGKSFRSFFRFGSKLTLAGLLHSLWRDIYLASIGKVCQAGALGLYTRAHQFGALPSFNVSNIIQRVTYPLLCREREKGVDILPLFRRFQAGTALLTLPVMTILAAVATPLVTSLLGPEWAGAGRLLSILCFSMMWMPVDTLNLNLLQVAGRTDRYLKCEVWKKIVAVVLLAATLPFGLEAVCWGQVARALFDLAVDSHYTRLDHGYSWRRQAADLLPAIACSAVAGVAAWIVSLGPDGVWPRLALGLTAGILGFLLAAVLTNPPGWAAARRLVLNAMPFSRR